MHSVMINHKHVIGFEYISDYHFDQRFDDTCRNSKHLMYFVCVFTTKTFLHLPYCDFYFCVYVYIYAAQKNEWIIIENIIIIIFMTDFFTLFIERNDFSPVFILIC